MASVLREARFVSGGALEALGGRPAGRGAGWTRRIGVAAALALLVLVAGDRWALTNAPVGIDPLEVLDIAVRPNAYIVLSSAGTMREKPDGVDSDGNGLLNMPAEGEITGDDPTSKLYQAKQALKQIVQANQSKVSFRFGRYVQDANNANAPETLNRFVYTSTDPNAANIIVNPGGSGASSPGIKRSATDQLTIGGTTIYHLFAGRFWNGQTIHINNAGVGGFVVAAGAPDPVKPYIYVRKLRSNGSCCDNSTPAPGVRFELSGIRWNKNGTTGTCGGFNPLVSLAPCDRDVQFTDIAPYLEPELPALVNGQLPGYVETLLGVAPLTPPQANGIRASGHTPIAEALIDLKGEFDTLWSGTISGQNPKQKTFAILIADSDDTCIGPNSPETTTGAPADNRALRAAYQAQLLRAENSPGVPESGMPTYVVAFGSGINATRANWIAWAGSGMVRPNDGTRWTSPPTDADRAACTTCRDAFLAADSSTLVKAISAALVSGQGSGTFSDQQSITESVFELVGTATLPSPAPSPAPDPLNPETRYNATVPLLLQSTFDMPDFSGRLKAFRAADLDGDGRQDESLLVWDAAQRLNDRVFAVGSDRTFTDLTGGLSRRILTTQRNGVFATDVTNPVSNLINRTGAGSALGSAPDGLLGLWPPSASVNPTVGTAGVLDDELGIASLTFEQLKAEFGACAGWPAADVTGCGSATVATRTAAALKEAREMILAFTAGAQVMKTAAGTPKRQAGAPYPVLYQARPFVLAESSLSAPAVVAPPLDSPPSVYKPEYTRFFDTIESGAGRAQNGIDKGFGLRHPDKDGSGDLVAEGDLALKPVMTVVYHGANDMLHAFRGGPQPFSGTTCVPSATQECGGEELWAFVPYDQIIKLRERMQPQGRDNHTYVIASPLRFADVFVPGTFSTSVGTETVGGAGEKGVWRTVLFFGRGIAGRHLTAIDVTVPGPFTRRSLDTNLPIVLWSRGNPDTDSGLLAGSPGTTLNHDTDDYNAYLKMGQTWSVPSIALVDRTKHLTSRKAGGADFVAYVGSGYKLGTDPAEGRTFFVLDALTGDLVRGTSATSPVQAHVIPNRSSPTPTFIVDNALVGSPAVFNASQLSSLRVGNPANGFATGVYFGDLHGRIWKYVPGSGAAPTVFADLTIDGEQPVATGIALINFDSSSVSNGCSAPGRQPHVFFEAGHDRRVPAPSSSPTFRLYGYCDPGGSGVGEQLFAVDLGPEYRGTAQPATAFANSVESDPTSPLVGRVFFAGTKQTEVGCQSQFSSVLFALSAADGAAAYDLNGSGGVDTSIEVVGQRINAIRVAGGKLVVDTGLQAQVPPPAPASSKVQGGPNTQSDVFTQLVRQNSLVCRE